MRGANYFQMKTIGLIGTTAMFVAPSQARNGRFRSPPLEPSRGRVIRRLHPSLGRHSLELKTEEFGRL